MIPLGAVAPKIGVVEWTTEEMERAIDWLGGWEQAPPITSAFMLFWTVTTRARSHSSTHPPCGLMWTCWHHGQTQHTKEAWLLRRYQFAIAKWHQSKFEMHRDRCYRYSTTQQG
jgi:hypothetical protein